MNGRLPKHVDRKKRSQNRSFGEIDTLNLENCNHKDIFESLKPNNQIRIRFYCKMWNRIREKTVISASVRSGSDVTKV